ncbi:uncharacterized protein V6R79_013035, partial [Siganus canaliculatus]
CFTAPSQAITILTTIPEEESNLIRSEVTADQHVMIHVITNTTDQTMPISEEEPYPGFDEQLKQILKEADALDNDLDRDKLRQVLYKYKDAFAKDSLDCGLTNVHT